MVCVAVHLWVCTYYVSVLWVCMGVGGGLCVREGQRVNLWKLPVNILFGNIYISVAILYVHLMP